MKQSLPLLIILVGALLYLPASTSTLAGKKPLLQSFCNTLTTTSTPLEGRPSNLTFACPSNPAFSVHQAASSIPTFTLPVGYSALYTFGPTIIQLTSGTPTSLQPGTYLYLAKYNGANITTLPTFTITWSS